ncbi:MAG: dTMP kinase [Anaerolineaceae bacterium]|nr:dTMP kinase [Anaerolineaceae bacterium]MBN2677422.1 dTMP kinase [Anaerolineaceae bacterium]
MTGFFITLEGPEGSGKTSQIPLLADYVHSLGHTVLLTREPGGTFIGDQIRKVLVSLDNKALTPQAETLLFLAARAQLVEEVIKPALANGVVVISDRYADATLAYQGYGHGVDLDVLKKLLEFATSGLQPDLIILLDIEVERGLRRKTDCGEWNRLDAYSVAFHERVRKGYRSMAEAAPHIWNVIDANRDRDLVQADMRQAVAKTLKSISPHHEG